TARHRRHPAREHARRQVQADRMRAIARQPARTRRRTTADLQNALSGNIAEQMPIALVQSLGTPDEFTAGGVDTEKFGMGIVVLAGVGIPPAPAGTFTVRGID